MADTTDTEWRSNSNDAVRISLVQPGTETPKAISEFHPHFTYPIFGEEESVFGYKDLNIEVRFAAHDLYPHVETSYAQKFKPVGETQATDLLEQLKPYLPSYAFEKPEQFNTRLQEEDATSFQPPGELVHSYTKNNRSYEIWRSELSDPSVKLLLERMQIFVSFYIEAGMPLNLDDQEWTLARWRVFFVYEILATPPGPKASKYSIVGYSTSYRFLTYVPSDSEASATAEIPPKEPISVSSLPCRGRISQFLILPPHQKQSHGSQLYNTMVDTFLKDPACIEITVEDPNESFDDLRDYSDFHRLSKNGSFSQLKLNTDIDPKLSMRRSGVLVPTGKLINKTKFDALKSQNKIAPRQWNRLVEMYLLSKLPKHTRESGKARLTQKGKASDPADRAFYYWRLLVKQRIYKQNRDVLVQLDSTERIEKLEETLGAQLDEYLRLLRRIEEDRSAEPADVPASSGGSTRGKRKVIEDDEDEDVGIDSDRDSKRRREDEGST